MAYVAISNALVSSAEYNIRQMRDKEKALHASPPESGTVPDNDGNIMALIWGSHHHLRHQMPEDWKRNPGKVTLRVSYQPDPTHERRYTVDFQLTAPSGFECPNTNENNSSSYYGNMIKVDESSPLIPQGARDLIAHCKTRSEIDARWEGISSKVRQFLHASKSLNEALKLWPGLSLYINKDYLDRVALKVTAEKKEKPKTSAEELLGTIDVDTLTAAAVASKLTV